MPRLNWDHLPQPPPIVHEAPVRIKPSHEIAHINGTGKIATAKCRHLLIPGLDADWCPRCRTWWFDQSIRDQLLTRKF